MAERKENRLIGFIKDLLSIDAGGQFVLCVLILFYASIFPFDHIFTRVLIIIAWVFYNIGSYKILVRLLRWISDNISIKQ